ncbi:MAG: DNA primase [Actinomycetia bacterium]|nr:DNA primase [Actinomycetes bacterium]
MGIVDEDVARVRQSTDMAALVGEYTQLRRVGQRWVGLCPFHAEKSPSFSVNATEGLYHCFGCKASGDAITFLRAIEHLDFVDAVESLAGRANIPLRYTERGGGEERKRKTRLYEVMERAVEWYHERLRTGSDAAQARAYLRHRGFTADEVGRYQVGWAPDGWDQLTRSLKLSQSDLEATGLGMLNRRNRLQDFFRARVLFPIYDEQGRPIGFGGRKLPDTDGPKYQNSRDNVLYHKSRALYGLNWAKGDVVSANEVVICEGYTDVIGFARAGIERAVATCGTALTEEHVQLLSRFTRRIVLAYDADEAGQSAAERVYEWEKTHDVGFWVVDMPGGTDPDELAREDPAALAAAVEGARPFLEFRVQRALAAADLESAEGRARGADDALGVIVEHPDSLVVDQYLMDLSDATRIEVARLRERLGEVRRRPREQPQRRPSPRDEPPPHSDMDAPSGAVGLDPMPQGAEREAIRLAVHKREVALPLLDAALFSDPTARAAWEAIEAAPTVAEAMASASPEVAEELSRLSVEDLAVETTDVMARLATEAARVELVELEMEARGAEDPLAYADAIGYLKVTIDDLRRPRAESETVAELLDWLKLRRSGPADQAGDDTGGEWAGPSETSS